MERRVSPRTSTRIPMAVSRGQTRYLARCVELSQTGLLAIVPKGIRDQALEYLSARLLLPGGIVNVLLRRVRRVNELVAYTIVDIDDASQTLLTDYLFEELCATLPNVAGRSRTVAA